MRTSFSILVVAAVLALASAAHAQDVSRTESRVEGLEDGRAALNRGNYTRAVTLLTGVVRRDPSADAFLYLGIAYENLRESVRAEETLLEGARRYPQDPRFQNELAETYLGRRDTEKARAALKAALAIDPANGYASDLLANVSMEDDDVRSALESWNRNGRPLVDEVLHNRYPNFGHWTVGKALTFQRGDTLHYGQWRTMERRLFETGLYANVGVDINPATRNGYYSVNVRTIEQITTPTNMLFDLVKGAPWESTYLDVWNPAGSGFGIHSLYRWESRRKRADLTVTAPIPVPGLLFAEIAGNWRSERWDVSPRTILPSSTDLFAFRSTGGSLRLKYIPDYRFEVSAGVEYRNRAASGGDPVLFADSSRNTAKLLSGVVLRVADRQPFRSQIRLEGFLSRRGLWSDLDYSGGTVEASSRWRPRSVSRAGMSWNLAAGTSRGEVPIDDYFVLGVEAHPRFLLRGHPVTHGGVSGTSPMGSAFLLANYAVEGAIGKVPTFQTVNLPYLEVKGEFFMDAAKTFDRARIFRQDGAFFDIGVGLQLATPTHALHLIYGQSTTDGRHAITAYLERIW